MKNNFAKTVNKKIILEKYFDAIITAINTSIENIDNQISLKEDGTNKIDDKLSINQLNKTKERQEELKNKIENKKDLTEFDFNLLSIILFNASHRVANTAATLAESAKQISEISKIFMA